MTPQSPISEAPTRRRYIDLGYLETHAFGQTDFVLYSIDILLEQIPELADKLSCSLRDQDWTGIAFAAHKLKSSAGLLGMSTLREQLITIEQSIAHDVHRERLQDLIEEVLHVSQHAIEELKLERRNYA